MASPAALRMGIAVGEPLGCPAAVVVLLGICLLNSREHPSSGMPKHFACCSAGPCSLPLLSHAVRKAEAAGW